MASHDHYFKRLAAAFVRGRQLQGEAIGLSEDLANTALDSLTEDDLNAILQYGAAAGLRLHRFKRSSELPRVRRVSGILRSLSPGRLLDIGSGRGVFLWPLLDEFPELAVSVIDRDPIRVRDLQAVSLGGVQQLTAEHMDATKLSFADGEFDVVTLLEVLEHIPDSLSAMREAVRVAGRCLVVSVPSKPDDNPQHIHFLDQRTLHQMLRQAGVKRVTFEHVLGHLIAVARTAK